MPLISLSSPYYGDFLIDLVGVTIIMLSIIYCFEKCGLSTGCMSHEDTIISKLCLTGEKNVLFYTRFHLKNLNQITFLV